MAFSPFFWTLAWQFRYGLPSTIFHSTESTDAKCHCAPL